MTGRIPPTPPLDPVLLTGIASAALLDGRGDLELPREMRGATVECGGVLGQCVRLTGAWRVGLRVGEAETSLPATCVAASAVPGGWTTDHAWEDLRIVEEVAAVSGVPGVVRTFHASTDGTSRVDLRLTSSFRPVLAPVLVEGIEPHRFELESRPDELRIRQRVFGLSARSTVPPSFLILNRASWLGGKWKGRVDEVGAEFSLPVGPGAPTSISLLVHGGLVRDLDAAHAIAERVLADPSGAARSVDADDRAWIESTPSLSCPDAPALTRGYAAACAGLRRLYCAPGDEMTGLVAGYPWYAALWGRDLAWMLEAVAWLGDLDWMRRSIDTVVRYQCRANLPLVGGEPGELPMQISPGPVFFYGTSDTTLYVASRMEEWLAHSGTPELPAGWAEALDRSIDWGEARTDPATGLLRHGGEAEEIEDATAGLARVRYGIDAPDTTIWDSADRRDHAIDIQTLWWEALTAARRLETGPRTGAVRESLASLADRVAASVRREYPWPAEEYLFDTLRDGRGTGPVRPNALRAVSAGLFDAAAARRIVARAARPDLSTDWGVRTRSSADPGYLPQAYHEGQVWTIATSWLADAALAAGEHELGVATLLRIADLLVAPGRGPNECFRGDRPEPFDSCFLLGFSVAPFVTVLFRRLWGLRIDARQRRLDVHPRFPSTWSSARMERLRVGPGTVDLDWTPARLRVGWSGPGPLTVHAGTSPVSLDAGATGEMVLPAVRELS
jgi:glycogen debranching enzyme